MKNCIRFSLCLFLLLLLDTGSCSAVTIPGYDGSTAALSQIGDIIRHVRGFTSRDLTLDKESMLLLKVEGCDIDIAEFSVPGIEYTSLLYSFDVNGNSRFVTGEQKQQTSSTIKSMEFRPLANGVPLAALPFDSLRGANGIMSLPISILGYSGFGYKESEFFFKTSNDKGSFHIDTSIKIEAEKGEPITDIGGPLWRALNLSENNVILDIKNGITVNGFASGSSAGISAVLVQSKSSVYVYFILLKEERNNGRFLSVSKIPCDYSQAIPDDSLPAFFAPGSSETNFTFPAAIAAGDFDNDGFRNEIALVWSDIDHVYLRVIQLVHNGTASDDTQFSVREIYASTIHDYDYSLNDGGRGIGKSLDGVSAVYSVSVTAGDFDGDRKDEFAVVFRDNKPDVNIYRHTFTVKDVTNSNFESGVKRTMTFEGLTGRIHVVTHKWNGTTFRTDEQTRNYVACTPTGQSNYYQQPNRYSWYEDNFVRDYNIPVAVKSVTADMDGDGKDDVVTLIMCLRFKTHETCYSVFDSNFSQQDYGGFDSFSIAGCIDVWNYKGGSITPEPLPSLLTVTAADYQGGQNDGRRGSAVQTLSPQQVQDFRAYGSNKTTVFRMTRAMLYEMVTRDKTNQYQFFNSEFDVRAGKFTGTLGDVTTVNDLVIVHPVIAWEDTIKRNSVNLIRKAVSVVPGIYSGNPSPKKITEAQTRECYFGIMPANFLGEGVKLGNPVKITSERDIDYTAILQAIPYHVDNLTADGKSLAKQPRSFTLRLDTAVTYTNTSTSSDLNNLTYGMTKKAETIFALDSDFTRGASKVFQGVRGMTSALIGSTDVGKKIDLVGKVWDKLKDTVETTTSKSNEYSQSYTMSITAQSNYYDTLYSNNSKRYIWRYPVLTYPAPDWLVGQVKYTNGSFDKSQVKKEQLYVTFAMSEPSVPVAAIGINDSFYQPYHEIGNLFSYPSDLSQVEGYTDSTYMANSKYNAENPIEWRGANLEENITFTHAVTSQDSTVKVNKIGAVTKFLSAIDLLFGSDFAQIPQDSSSSFTRTVTNQEGLSIKIPEAFSNARFYMRFAPFLDATGATNVAFAVNYFERDDALWGEDSLYSKRPDPSLLLPEKFNHVEKSGTDMDRAVFEGNDNDPTAMKARGIRYIMADYDINSDNLLLNGMRYKIRVPVYNASFVDADNFKVRLSYAKTNKYNTERTTIGDYTFAKLPGRSSGNNRQYAEFEWTPEVADGLYYLFVDIDPENKINEVHENRRNAGGDIVDYGGNNMGFFRIGVSTSDNLVFDRSKLQTSSAGEFEAAEYELPYIHASVSGDLTIEDLIRERVESKAGIVPFEINLTNDGEYVMPNLTLIGYKLKPESKGKDIPELSDEDIGLIFLRANSHVFPGEDNTVYFRINPAYLEDGIGFLLQTDGAEYALTDVIYRSGGSSDGVSGASSGGCGTGFSGLAGLAVIGILMLMKRK